VKVPPFRSVIWPPPKRAGTTTEPWKTRGLCWSPLGYQALLFWGTVKMSPGIGTTIVPPPPPPTHSAWNVTIGLTNATWIVGCAPGIVKS